MPYAEYLKTTEWRRVRDRALKLAGYTCSRCQSPRELQVHHLTYARVGAEEDRDLEVLCRGCHLGHHAVEAEDRVQVYVAIVSQLLRIRDYDSLSMLVEDAKRECIRLKIYWNHGQISAAINTVTPRFQAVVPRGTADLLARAEDSQDATLAEAAATLSRLLKACGPSVGIKHMPQATPSKIDIYGPVPRDDQWGDHDHY